MIRYLMTIIVIAFVVSGCVMQQPVVLLEPSAPCEEILNPVLLTIPFKELSDEKEETESWLVTQFPTATIGYDSSLSDNTTGSIGRFYWSENDKGYSLTLTRLSSFLQQEAKKHPTLGQIIQCYGDPTYYTLQGDVPFGPETNGVWLEMWYPERGLRFESTTWGASEIRHFDTSSPINGYITVMPTGTIEEVIRNWEAGREEDVQKKLALLKKWPDDFTELVVEE